MEQSSQFNSATDGDENIIPTESINIPRFIITGHVNAVFMTMFFVTGLPWNTLVIAIILKKKLFTRPSVLLMFNLAIVNFSLCMLVMPFSIVFGIIPETLLKEHEMAHKICQGSGVFVIALLLMSTITIAMMAVDRVIYLAKPLTYGHIVTAWRMFFAMVSAWLLCITLSLPPLLGFGEVSFDRDTVACGPRFKDYYFVLIIIPVALATLVQLSMCLCIIYIARKHLSKKLRRALVRMYIFKSPAQQSHERHALREYNKSQLQLVKVFGVIFTASLLTIFPTTVVVILGAISSSIIPQSFFPIAYITILSKSVIHPVIESYMTREIYEVTFLPCMRRCRCCTRANTRISATNPAFSKSSDLKPASIDPDATATPKPATSIDADATATPKPSCNLAMTQMLQ